MQIEAGANSKGCPGPRSSLDARPPCCCADGLAQECADIGDEDDEGRASATASYRWGSIGLSREDTLGGKAPEFSTFAGLIREYRIKYEGVGHDLLKVYVGLPFTHDPFSVQPVRWRVCSVHLKHRWEKVAALLNRYARDAPKIYEYSQRFGLFPDNFDDVYGPGSVDYEEDVRKPHRVDCGQAWTPSTKRAVKTGKSGIDLDPVRPDKAALVRRKRSDAYSNKVEAARRATLAAQPVRYFCLHTRGVLKRWNVRCRRSLVGDVICQLDDGTIVGIRGVEVGGWLELADGRGWVLRQHPKYEGVGWVEQPHKFDGHHGKEQEKRREIFQFRSRSENECGSTQATD